MNILITGANRGIGLETARQLGKKGGTVFFTARKEAAKIATLEELNKMRIQCKGYVLDLSSMESIDSFLDTFEEEIDILINNAGVHLIGSPSNIEKSDLVDAFHVNMMGPWYLTSKLMPKLSRSKNPKIINITSGAGSRVSQHHSPIKFASYRISKLAFNEYTRMLSQELPDWQINAVCPGWVKTRMGGKHANTSLEDGVDTIVWLAMENPGTGNFYRNRRVIPW